MHALEYISNYNKMLTSELENIKSILTRDKLTGCCALYQKIEHMVLHIGQPTSVEPMIRAILKGTKWIKFPSENYIYNSTNEARKDRPNDTYKRSNRGHFRWDFKVYMLTDKELKVVSKLLKS